jgi:hypothetical protein
MLSVDTILDGAWKAASNRANTDDLACGILAALRRLHQVVEENGGETAAGIFLASVRQVVMQATLQRIRFHAKLPIPVKLSPPRPQSRRACAILEDAANACLALNCQADDNGPLCDAMEKLLTLLFDLLGGTPETDDIVSRVAAARPFITITVPTACARPIN